MRRRAGEGRRRCARIEAPSKGNPWGEFNVAPLPFSSEAASLSRFENLHPAIHPMLPPWAASLRPALTLDLRSLALFRVILATTLLCDGLARLGLLRAFLTDDGVVPRALITTSG